MTMITPSYLGETIEYSSLHACRSTLEDPTKAFRRSPSLEISTWCKGILTTQLAGEADIVMPPGSVSRVPTVMRIGE